MCQYSSQFQGNALYLIDYLRSELQHQCPTALCPEQEHLSPAVPSPQVNLQAAWDRCVHRHICWKSELSSGWQPGGILIKLIIVGALPLPHLPLITLPFYPTHPIEDFSLLFFFVDHAKNSVHLFSLCCRWRAQHILLFTDPRHLPITFVFKSNSSSKCSHLCSPSLPVPVPWVCLAEMFTIFSSQNSVSSPPQPPWSKQTHLHVHLDHGGLTRPTAETPVLEPAAGRRRWLWFGPLSRQPEGNCCHVPGLTLQLHLLSAERRAGLESKRLIDLAKALFHNLLTSEMLSYEAKVMEKFS